MSDIWALQYNATNLTSGQDTDGDGVPNWAESIAATDPQNPDSAHELKPASSTSNRLEFTWLGLRGKRYDLMTRSNLVDGGWTQQTSWMGSNANITIRFSDFPNTDMYWSVRVVDLDSDADGLSDWEELAIGYQPYTNRSNRTTLNDSNKVVLAMLANNDVTVAAIDSQISEGWADDGVFAIRRKGRIDRITVPFTISGSATLGADYTLSTNGSITLEPGIREAWVFVHPLQDATSESAETVVLAVTSSAWFRLSSPAAATVTIADATGDLPTPKAASRFLTQATFGPRTQDIAELCSMGYDAWLTNQFALPPSFHSSVMQVVTSAYQDVYSDHKTLAWWENAMHAPDQLRQRMAWALSQILVISDNNDTLVNQWQSMVGFYDLLVGYAFGNYRDLLLAVSRHPAMGIYLSHFGNMKADPETGRFPDENYAREVMQLFSIGLWQLNQDGTKILATNGLPIPTYSNADITELARVFTGLSWGSGDTNLWWEFFWPSVYEFEKPMQMWEVFHDTDTKTLVGGTVLPANQPGMKDVADAVENLVNYPSAAPFICRQLIQRFTTSNPSTGYIARVAAAFANNGQGVRGDLKAVITAILMDPEARDAEQIEQPTMGKLREPYLRVAHLARSFNASATNGFYEMWRLSDVLGMQPYSSPSVFSFYSPNYQPAGPIRDADLVAPEFQITTAVTGITTPNHVYTSVEYALNRWPDGTDSDVHLDFTPWLGLASDPDALIGQLDLLLTSGHLRPPQHQIVREALERMTLGTSTQRVRMAVYLMSTSPEFAVQK